MFRDVDGDTTLEPEFHGFQGFQGFQTFQGFGSIGATVARFQVLL